MNEQLEQLLPGISQFGGFIAVVLNEDGSGLETHARLGYQKDLRRMVKRTPIPAAKE